MPDLEISGDQTILSMFHPVLAEWFEREIGHPTPVQNEAWPKIASGEHVLITAPTGSGKTFTAFLWAINQYITGEKIPGRTGVLYISPLKALNNDIRRNLLEPLDALDQAFQQAGKTLPDIRVLTRSGDTPQSDRRRMLRHPPEILITTPESLNLMLSSSGGRSILTGISTVILDEIHSVVGTKRGVHLITAVDRLVRLSGEFQRIALSATIRPLETVAEYVGGYAISGSEFEPGYALRSVSIIDSGKNSQKAKKYNIQVIFPERAANRIMQESIWEPLADEFKRIISANRSTLLFVNSRRLCEKLAFIINKGESRSIVYAHHGSLSREIRETVEQKFKAGELKGIIATSSLELGIDIGTLDEVLLIQSPFSISSAIQKIGRAGHQVGEISRGKLFPTHPRSFIEAAALTRGIFDQDIEAINPIQCPLDVLAQIIISMTAVETWDIDMLFNRIRTSYPYRKLNREQFDLVLNMLTGRYADSRIRELNPRISIDRIDNTVVAKKGAVLALYMSGGTIPDRGYYRLRHYKTNAIIGELDEEFVWEARIGQTFNLGTQSWRIDRITHNDVFAFPGSRNVTGPPFWKAEAYNRDFHFSERIGSFLQYADRRLDYPDFAESLQQERGMDAVSVQQLIDFLKRQKQKTGCSLPHRHHLLVEFINVGPGGAPGNQVVLHTMWGGRVNRPFAMALEEAWEERYKHTIEINASNDCVLLLLPHEVDAVEILSLVTSLTVESLLKKRLEKTGFFGARFRECAGRSLLLTKKKVTERVPLWLNRLQSKKLMDSVLQYEDFPILIETWRTCLQDEFDLDNLKTVLTGIESGSTAWTEIHIDHPSPMAQSESWQQINQYMYMDDTPQAGKTSMLKGDLLQDLVFTPDLRPAVSGALVEIFELKRRRLYQGYSPDTAQDLLDWVKERLVVPEPEWKALLHSIQTDHDLETDEMIAPISDKLLVIKPPDAVDPMIVAREKAAYIVATLYGQSSEVRIKSILSNTPRSIPDIPGDAAGENDRDAKFTNLIGEWLQFYGPVTLQFIHTTLGINPERLSPAIDDLVDTKKIITGRLIENGPDSDEYLCDSENYEVLLRIKRKEAEPSFEPIDIGWLPLFLASHQGITEPDNGREPDIDRLFDCIEQLLCFTTSAELWETEIFPARMQSYDISWLDSTMQDSDLIWIGSENRRIAFCFESDLDLIQEGISSRQNKDNPESAPQAETDIHNYTKNNERKTDRLLRLFSSVDSRYNFSTLLQTSSYNTAELTDRLWDSVWRGYLTNDTFITLRRGIENKFKAEKVAPQKTRPSTRGRRFSSRTRFSKWKSALPSSGYWHIIPTPESETDLLESEELKKERVRLLLDRYGILFRELLLKELPDLRWASLFRSLRLMEFSGEVLTGCFFNDIPGLQFISHQAFQRLRQSLPEDSIYWINATDPASLCGIQLDKVKGTLPRRIPGTHLVYQGNRIVIVSKRNGRSLLFNVPPDDPQINEYLEVLNHLLTRQFQPLRQITIETINEVEAARSEYVDSLSIRFEAVIDYKNVILYKKRV